MPFDMSEFEGTAEEAALANPPEPVDPRTGIVQGMLGGPQPARVAPVPQNQPIIGNAAEIVASMLGQRPPQPPQGVTQSDEADDEYMSEVEARLDVAAHYQLLLKDSFFQTNSRAARQVTTELRTWVKERLAELVGMQNPKKLQLSDETIQVLSELSSAEIYALKSVASKLIAGGFTAPASTTNSVPPPKPKAPAAPALIKRGGSTGTVQSSPPPPPEPTEEPQRRGPGRPAGSKNRKHAQTDNPNKIKFPASNSEMSAATFMASSQQVDRTVSKNPLVNVAMAMPPTPGTVRNE